MYITLETDYAVRITAELCRSREKLDAKALAERTNVTLRFSLKILRKLVAAGIVKSFKGTQGGYIIAAEPSEITLKSVIEAIEGQYYFSRCLDPETGCSRGAEDNCRFREAFADITKTVGEKLESYDFAELAGCTDD